ncbi:putative ferric-chelate reductase 1 homolog isoform X2 [Culicoides brevitarsis]|uniref:putative ferric-chelate reductase 1 homolog isoform X2 n=1 Tax=Culicoides brevitarsis TaxID=469753 RepID=UPI00307B48B8
MTFFRPLSILLLLVSVVVAYPSGAPNAVCETLSPRHKENVPQTDPSPFVFKLNSTEVMGGDVVEVTVTSDTPGKTFRGFVAQAREDIAVYEPRGTFILEDGSPAKTSKCKNEDDTVTHISRDDKTAVKFYYKAPNDFAGVVTITGTILEVFTTFYEKVQSPQITIRNNGQSSSTTEKPSVNDTLFDTCGTTKSCFGQPDNCIERNSCSFATTVAKSPEGNYIFELISFEANAKWVAVALSSSEFMSDTSVMECVKNSNAVSDVKKYDSWMSKNPRGVTRQGIVQTTSKLISTRLTAHMFMCNIERPAKTTVNNQIFDLDNTEYHLLLASGTDLSDNGDSIGIHNLGAKASDKRLLGDIRPFASPSNLLYKLHGVFMFTAWLGTSTIGIFFARYFKKQWQGRQFMQKDLWFVGHQASMILTWLLTIVGFILIFVKIGAWSSTKNPHPILGLITTILCFIQPLGALFRPAPNAKNRRWFNWIHFVIGNTAHFLGLVSIFFAVSLMKAELPFEMYYIMIAFGVYYAVAHILFSVATEEENLNELKTSGGSSCKNFLLLAHVVIVLILTVVGIVLICRPIDDSR